MHLLRTILCGGCIHICITWSRCLTVGAAIYSSRPHLLEYRLPAGSRCCHGNRDGWGSSARTSKRHVPPSERSLCSNTSYHIIPAVTCCTCNNDDNSLWAHVSASSQQLWWRCRQFPDRTPSPRRPFQTPPNLKQHLVPREVICQEPRLKTPEHAVVF